MREEGAKGEENCRQASCPAQSPTFTAVRSCLKPKIKSRTLNGATQGPLVFLKPRFLSTQKPSPHLEQGCEARSPLVKCKGKQEKADGGE